MNINRLFLFRDSYSWITWIPIEKKLAKHIMIVWKSILSTRTKNEPEFYQPEQKKKNKNNWNLFLIHQNVIC